MNETCETCRFWARDDFGRALGGPHIDGSVSDCRHNPPIAVKDGRLPASPLAYHMKEMNDGTCY